jgi:DNA-binding transcriptional regulator YiaG
MTPDAFRSELSRLGLTQAGAAAFLDVDERTVRRWAAGDKPVPKTVELLLAKLTPEEVSSQ